MSFHDQDDNIPGCAVVFGMMLLIFAVLIAIGLLMQHLGFGIVAM